MPIDLCAARRKIIASGLAARKLDALLVSFGANLRYLSGFTGSNGMLLLTPSSAVLFTDPRYTIQAGQESSCEVRIARGPLTAEAIGVIASRGLRRIGYEAALMTCETYHAVQSHLPKRTALLPAGGWIEQLRMVKSEDELAAIRQSVLTNSRAFEETVAQVRPGVSERDVAAELEYRMRKLGAEKPSFETIVAGGERSALPHANPTSAVLDHGLVVVDMGAIEAGYCSDMTRMLHVGAPNPKTKRMYKAVLEAQLAAVHAVRAGVTAAHIDAVARRVLRAYSLDRAFIHSTGHGLGLEIHEAPRLGKRDKTRLLPGMAITIEPGVYLEGFGGIRIEDTVVVTKKGCEVLTPTSKELRVI